LCRLIYLKRGTPPTFKRKSTSNRKPTALPKHPISFKLRVFQQYRRKADLTNPTPKQKAPLRRQEGDLIKIGKAPIAR
ncbi:MAG: hypothetical protein ACK5SF_11220, partial [Hyphomonadaceae bacterium]